MVARDVVRTINELNFTHYIARRIWKAAGRIWVWYWDGTNIIHQSRLVGGGSWTSPEAVRACDDRLNFATWFDGTYFHYAYSQGNVSTPDSSVFYRRGLANADGSITWSAAEQTVLTHNASWRRRRLTICVDDGDYPWIAWQRVQKNGSHNYEPYITTSSTKDGTWTTVSGFPFQARNTQSSNYSSIVPMTGGKVMIITGGGYQLWYRILTQSSMGSTSTISGTQMDNRQFRHNAVAIGDVVYLCYQWGTAAIRFRVYNGSWSAYDTPATPADRPGLLAKKDDSTLMLFWENAANVIMYKQYTISGGSWSSQETFIDESGDTISAWRVMQASYDGEGYPFLHYATKAGAPYDMIFAEWEPPYVDLHAQFFVKQWAEDLPAEFFVNQWQEDLLGKFDVQQERAVDLLVSFDGQVSLDLPGEFVARPEASVNLLGTFRVQQTGTADLKSSFAGQVTRDLLGAFFVNQWQAELLCGFVVRHSAFGDLPAGFFVKQWQEDLHAEFEVGQDAVELLGLFSVQQEASVDLLGAFFVRNTGTADLLGEFIVKQWQEDLPGEFITRHSAFGDLPTGFIVKQWQENLYARFRVENIFDLTGTAGIAFYWQGADNPPESIVDFIVESPTGFWVAEFYDGPAHLRYVFIPWTQFRETGIDGTRPDKSRVDGFIYIVHTDGRRRIDYIHAPIFGDLYAFFNVRHTATPRNLKASFSIRRTAVPLNLKAEFTVRHAAGVDLAVGFTSQAVRDLPAEFVIRHPASAELSAEFTVA